jgi:hypothetical protein
MRTLLAVAIMLVAASAAGEIRYAERIKLEADGSAVVDVRVGGLSGGAGDSLVIPYAPAVWPDSIHCAGPLAGVASRSVHGRLQAALVLGSAAGAADTLLCRYFYHAYASLNGGGGDFGNIVLGYRAVQTLPDSLGGAAVTIVLPPEYVTNKVLSSTPGAKANSSALPYELGMEEGRHSVTLRASPVLQGDVVALSLEVKRRGGSTFLIVALVIIACAYLVGFRDLVIPTLSKDRNHGTAL